jgi:methylated-DNA-[protein]-cysteine S-methyltransferase
MTTTETLTLATSYYLSPLGTIEIKANETHLVSVLFVENILKENPNALTALCIQQLDEYFGKTRKKFELPLLQEGTDFQKLVWNSLLKIPHGRTVSYKELAARSGKAANVRAVGAANGQNKLMIVVPCHRVIGSDGKLVGYAGELWRKQWLLDFESENKPGIQLGLGY